MAAKADIISVAKVSYSTNWVSDRRVATSLHSEKIEIVSNILSSYGDGGMGVPKVCSS